MAAAVLQVQELCDHIADFRQDSVPDLKAYSLVSPTSTVSAQRHLFHTASLMDMKSCEKFCTLIEASPHLLPLVRRLRTRFAPGLHERLSTFAFPNLQRLYIERQAPTTPTPCIRAAATLIALPSLRRLELVAIRFDSLDEFALLFAQCTPQLDTLFLGNITFLNRPAWQAPAVPPSLGPVRRVKIADFQPAFFNVRELPWLFDARCPIEFNLTSLDLSMLRSPGPAQALLDRARPTVRHLKINLDHAQDPPVDERTAFSTFPALTHVTIRGDFGANLPKFQRLPLASATRLEKLTLEFEGKSFDPWAFRPSTGEALPFIASALADADAPLPALRLIELVVRVEKYSDSSDLEGDVSMEARLRTAFGVFAGRLDVWYVKTSEGVY